MDCLFCKIVNGEINAYKLYENEKVLVFLDINPQSNGHVLVIPKKHYKDFTELDDEILLEINEVSQKMVNLIAERLGTTGFSLVTNYLDRQEIKHFHLHIIPNSKGKKKDIKEIYELLK